MRFTLAVVLLATSLSAGAAFAPASSAKFGVASRSVLFSTVEVDAAEAVAESSPEVNGSHAVAAASSGAGALSSAEVASRLEKQLTKLAAKDSTSPQLSKEVSGRKPIVSLSVMFQLFLLVKIDLDPIIASGKAKESRRLQKVGGCKT
jgi:hypothetical protein